MIHFYFILMGDKLFKFEKMIVISFINRYPILRLKNLLTSANTFVCSGTKIFFSSEALSAVAMSPMEFVKVTTNGVYFSYLPLDSSFKTAVFTHSSAVCFLNNMWTVIFDYSFWLSPLNLVWLRFGVFNIICLNCWLQFRLIFDSSFFPCFLKFL